MTNTPTLSAPSAHVIIVPGFLTEPIGQRFAQDRPSPSEGGTIDDLLKPLFNLLPMDKLESLDPTKALDARAWVLEMRGAIDPQHSVKCFEWASESLVELLINTVRHLMTLKGALTKASALSMATQLAREIQQTWRRAEREADASAERLYQEVATQLQAQPSRPVYVIGHSLGGRITLRLAELIAQRPLEGEVHLSAWAPAIKSRALNWEELCALPSPPEVLFSEHDAVLKYFFKLGEISLTGTPLDLLTLGKQLVKDSDALGLTGDVPAPHAYPAKRLVNISERKVGHLDYLTVATELIATSSLLKPLDVIKELTPADPDLLS
jgi:hypothetical protein